MTKIQNLSQKILHWLCLRQAFACKAIGFNVEDVWVIQELEIEIDLTCDGLWSSRNLVLVIWGFSIL